MSNGELLARLAEAKSSAESERQSSAIGAAMTEIRSLRSKADILRMFDIVTDEPHVSSDIRRCVWLDGKNHLHATSEMPTGGECGPYQTFNKGSRILFWMVLRSGHR